jgi:hypothetical protein
VAPVHEGQIQQVGADAGAERVLGALLADGAVVIRDLLPPDVLLAINEEVEPFVELADPDMRHLNPGVQIFHAQTRHVSGLAGKSPTFATEVLIHPLLLAVCDAILGPSCARYQLNLAHLLERLPGVGDQFWHRDEIVWNLMPEPKPELQLASVIALVDFTAENGATRVFPGSTEENNYLAVPPELACRLPRRCQEVLGYAVHDAIERGGGYLGMLDLRDPIELFAEGWTGAARTD